MWNTWFTELMDVALGEPRRTQESELEMPPSIWYSETDFLLPGVKPTAEQFCLLLGWADMRALGRAPKQLG